MARAPRRRDGSWDRRYNVSKRAIDLYVTADLIRGRQFVVVRELLRNEELKKRRDAWLLRRFEAAGEAAWLRREIAATGGKAREALLAREASLRVEARLGWALVEKVSDDSLDLPALAAASALFVAKRTDMDILRRYQDRNISLLAAE